MAKKILIVDDDPSIVSLLNTRFTSEGYDVSSASTGEEAIAKVSSEKPLAIIMDVMMPQTSGYEAMQKIRQNPESKNIPAIIFSGKGSMKDFFADMAGVEFMRKPLDFKALIDRVDALVGGGEKRVNPLKRVVLGGVEDFLVAKIEALLKSQHFDVLIALHEKDAVQLIQSSRPTMVLCQFWEDEAVLDPRKIAQELLQQPALATIPFYVYCKNALSVEAMKHFKTDRIVTYKESSDLLLALEVLVKK